MWWLVQDCNLRTREVGDGVLAFKVSLGCIRSSLTNNKRGENRCGVFKKGGQKT